VSSPPLPDWDPRAPAVIADQRAAYDELRERCPVAFSEALGWSIFGHEDIAGVLADHETFSSATKRLVIPNGFDPPRHTFYRRALEPFFSGERVAAFEPECRAIAAEQVAALLESNPTDFIAEFADPFPLKVACRFLGWPQCGWEPLLQWMLGNQQAAFAGDRKLGAAIAAEYDRHVRCMLEERRTGAIPDTGDVTWGLMSTTVDGQLLTDDEIVSVLRTWTAGYAELSGALGIVVLHLARDQTLQEQLRTNPAGIGDAIEEILRLDGPLVYNWRTTTRGVTVGGRDIGEGERISLMWIAANRDPSAFQQPQTLDVDRDHRKNLLFGGGPHICIARQLARMELRVALEELLARVPAISPGTDGEPSRRPFPSNGLDLLPLQLG
jgi:cytochrome P450